MSSSSVKVAVRLRPMNAKEEAEGTLPVVHASSVDKTVTAVKGIGKGQTKTIFNYDTVFSSYATQKQVFESTLKPIVKDVLRGYESTVFAYGQTGTGKTHTMEGNLDHPDHYGVIPRSAGFIFDSINHSSYISRSVVVSCLEIYNEELRDLLADDDLHKNSSHSKSNIIDIYQGPGGVICKNLTEIKVESADDVLAAMKVAQKHRIVGETKMNLKSSRSHCVFTIRLKTQRQLKDGQTYDVHGKLHLVDLAGSECAKAALDKGIDGSFRDRGRERGNINKSLLTLGRVIIMLNEQGKCNKKQSPVRIPYRDSKLTRILQDSLGGHCKTIVIATISPSNSAIEETMSTLNYAQSASGIINKPVAESFIKSGLPDSSYFTPTKGIDVNGGVEQWYEMEMKMNYLRAQLDEAQAALARHYSEHKDALHRAEKAENELIETKEKLEKSEADLNKSISILLETKNVIVAQQNEIKQTKMEQKQLKENFVTQVLSGVTHLVNEQMNIISTQHEDKLLKLEQQNIVLSNSIGEASTLASSLVKKINDTGNSIIYHTNECRLNDQTMKANAELTSAAIDNFESLWTEQRKMVDSFVMESHDKANSFANQENDVAVASTTLQEEGNKTNKFVAETVHNNFKDGMTDLGKLYERQKHATRNSFIVPTKKNLDSIVQDRKKVVSAVTQSTEKIATMVIEGRDNIEKVTSRQCVAADELRDDVESTYSTFHGDVAKRRRSKIDARKEHLNSRSVGFQTTSTKLITSSASSASASEAFAAEYERNTMVSWDKVSPISSTKKRIDYRRTLSSTPDEETILKKNNAM